MVPPLNFHTLDYTALLNFKQLSQKNDEIKKLMPRLSCILFQDGYIAPSDPSDQQFHMMESERWPSGLRRTPGKRVERKLSRVRIPSSPPFYDKLFIPHTLPKAIIEHQTLLLHARLHPKL